MTTLLVALLAALGGAGGVAVIIAIIVLLNPEKVDIWVALFWRFLSFFGGVARGAKKRYVKHDLQGRLNVFSKGLHKDAPFLAETKVQVEFTDEITKKAFLEQGKVILRLRRDDDDDVNFMHGSYLFVSASLLAKTKRYVSPSQRKSLDLYMTTQLLQEEKPSVLGMFLDENLHPESVDADGKEARYIDAFAKIDEGGLFKEVVLQELDYLGDKVFGKRKDDKIVTEVNDLIQFLESVATRRIGEDRDLQFSGDYCRFGIVIVGKPTTVSASGHLPYVAYINKQLIPKQVETIYVVGRAENREVIDVVSQNLESSYEKVRSCDSTVVLSYDQGRRERKQYLVVLRTKGVRVIQPSQ